MSNIDKRALREVAERATPGNWRYLKTTPFMDAEISAENHTRVVNLLAGDVTEANSEFIALANPATVLALLDELEDYKAAYEEESRDKEVQRSVIDDALCKLLPGCQYMDLPDGGSVTPLEQVSRMIADYREQLQAAKKRISELESDNAYIRNRHKELDLLIGKNILVMQAAIIEWQGTGDARKGLAWIYNTLFGPGELPDEAEKDAQAYFDRKYAHLDEELMNLHRWFWEQSEAERAAAAGKGE